MNCTQDRADYLILLNGGSVKQFSDWTEQQAKQGALTFAKFEAQPVTLVKVIGTVEVVTQWKDAK